MKKHGNSGHSIIVRPVIIAVFLSFLYFFFGARGDFPREGVGHVPHETEKTAGISFLRSAALRIYATGRGKGFLDRIGNCFPNNK